MTERRPRRPRPAQQVSTATASTSGAGIDRRMRWVPRWRDRPLAVSAFAYTVTASVSYVIVRTDDSHGHPIASAFFIGLLVLWASTVVVWAERWAWLLWLLATLVGLIRGTTGGGALPLIILGVAQLGLLVSPGMLSWVGLEPPRFLRRKGAESRPGLQ
jgi:hypothetical protein